MCRLHHGHNKHDNAKSGRSGGASAKKSARRQTATQLSRLQSRQQLTYSLRYQNRRRIARTKVRAFIRGPLSGLQAQIQGPRNKATYTAKTVGCLCLSLSRDNHKQPTSSTAGYECYIYLLFLLSPYHFFTTQKDIFLELVTLESNVRGKVTVGNSKSFQRFALGETSPT